MMAGSGINPHDFLPPAACDPVQRWTREASIMVGGCVYGAVLALISTGVAWKIYQKHDLHEAASDQIRRLGSLWVVSVFFMCLGIFLGDRCVECTLGCSSCASECASISCVVANEETNAYVVLCLLLLVGCAIVLRNVNAMSLERISLSCGEATAGQILFTFDNGDGWRGILGPLGEWLIRAGFVATIITGLLPAKTSNCGLQPDSITELAGDNCFPEMMTTMHTNGIMGGLALGILGTFVRLFAPRKIGNEWKDFRQSVHASAPYIIALIVIAWIFLLCVGLVFLYLFTKYCGHTALEVDFCAHYKSESACLGQELPSAWYSWAAARKQADMPPGYLTTDGWQCEWLDNVSTVTASGCMMINCDHNSRLGPRKFAIIAEFLGLINGVYGIYFAIWTISIVDTVFKMEHGPGTGREGLLVEMAGE